MNPAVTIWKKECRSAMRSPIAWCVFAGFTSVTGVLFTASLRSASGMAEHLPALLCTQLLLALCIPVSLFTMSLFATERASGTLETLMTAPVTDTQVVLGKFASAFTLVCVSIAIACAILPVYTALAAPPPPFSTRSLYAGLAIVTLYAATWCAAGTLLSLLSHHQTPAAIASLVMTLASAAALTGNVPGFDKIAFMHALDIADFARGSADTRTVFTAASSLLFFLFCAVRVLESRRWTSAK